MSVSLLLLNLPPLKLPYGVKFSLNHLKMGLSHLPIGYWFAEGVGAYGNYSTGGIPSPYKIEIGSPFQMCVIYG